MIKLTPTPRNFSLEWSGRQTQKGKEGWQAEGRPRRDPERTGAARVRGGRNRGSGLGPPRARPEPLGAPGAAVYQRT